MNYEARTHTATNSALMRRRNERIILSLINKSPISRADIAKETGLTKAAVTIIVDELKKKGFVTEEKSESAGVGRTPSLLRLCKDSVYAVGINIRRVGINVGICDICGRVICERSLPVCPPDTAYEMIGRSVGEMIKEHRVPRSRIFKAAVVTPGPVDTVGGRVLNPPNFPDWQGAEVVDGIRSTLGLEVTFGNVSFAVAAAEKYFGAATDCDDFLALLIDEGIGSGIVKNGRLFDGSCEIGHISVKHDGKKCECGNVGCLEKYASVPSILDGTPYASWQECVEKEDVSLMLREAEYISCAVVTASNIFGLDRFVLCGEMARSPGTLLEMVERKSAEKMLRRGSFSAVAGAVRSHSLIAASMAVYDFFNA